MIRIILILIIIVIIYKIYIIKCTESSINHDGFVNITNPFVSGLSQFQLGSNNPDKSQMLVDMNLNSDSNTDYTINQNNILNKTNRISKVYNNIKKSKINDDINLISSLRKQKHVRFNDVKSYKNEDEFQLIQKSCVKLNKFFIGTQFNDSYRDIMTAINIICPDQKILFNLQSLPVITTLYDTTKKLPISIVKLVNQFIIKLNQSIKSLPESSDILNNYNNYLPLTADLKKYVENKGINKFYKDIGVDFNLYADTPPNAPVQFIKIIEARREYTDAETKYIITFVIKKVLESVNDQMKVSVHFVLKNDPLIGENLFDKTTSQKQSQQIAIEFIFIDGYYTNNYNADYDCYGMESNTKKISMTDGADNFYSFESLGKNNMLNDNEIITQLNKKYKEHEIEMSNFNVNIPYPIYQTPPNKNT